MRAWACSLELSGNDGSSKSYHNRPRRNIAKSNLPAAGRNPAATTGATPPDGPDTATTSKRRGRWQGSCYVVSRSAPVHAFGPPQAALDRVRAAAIVRPAMKAIIRSLLVGGLALAAGPRASADPKPAPPARGTVLLVDEDRLLEGDIEKVGDQYRIRRPTGETWVPARSALALVADRQAAYEFLRGRANLRDADERLRLAKWCHLRGLRDQAIAEAAAAVELRPGHAPTRDYLAALERAAAVAKSAPPAAVPAPEPPAEPPATPEVNAEAFKLFVTKVQPILMN